MSPMRTSERSVARPVHRWLDSSGGSRPTGSCAPGMCAGAVGRMRSYLQGSTRWMPTSSAFIWCSRSIGSGSVEASGVTWRILGWAFGRRIGSCTRTSSEPSSTTSTQARRSCGRSPPRTSENSSGATGGQRGRLPTCRTASTSPPSLLPDVWPNGRRRVGRSGLTTNACSSWWGTTHGKREPIWRSGRLHI